MKMLMIIMGCLVAHTAQSAWIPIYAAGPSPDTPTESDNIIIQASGEVSTTAWSIQQANAILGSGTVMLDIVFTEGGIGAPAITPWNHSEPIGALVAGTYNLTVNTWNAGALADSFQTQFDVIPEPASVGLLTAGTLILFLGRRKARRVLHATNRHIEWE